MRLAATNQANMADEQNELTVFTFWIGDELFAIDIANILVLNLTFGNIMI